MVSLGRASRGAATPLAFNAGRIHAMLLAFSAGCRESTDDERRMRGTVVSLRRVAVPSTLGDFQRARVS